MRASEEENDYKKINAYYKTRLVKQKNFIETMRVLKKKRVNEITDVPPKHKVD